MNVDREKGPRDGAGRGNGRRVTLAHGAGGRLTAELVREVFLKHFQSRHLAPLGDSALVPPGGGGLALTTDGFVVDPLFFPGGDIGRLAVCGTVNDLAVAGAAPAYLTASFIIEEGLPFEVLERVGLSMARAAEEAGVEVVTGDTKVVERGGCDKLFIVTSGVGFVLPAADTGASRVRPGDRLVLSGPVGQHGVAVLSQREGLGFASSVRSDCAPVAGLTTRLIEELGPAVRWMRDPTRGGLATVVCELAEETGLDVFLEEEVIPVPSDVAAACELLGLDPLYLANEGKVLVVVEEAAAQRAVDLLREAGQADAAVVGRVEEVVVRTPGGTGAHGDRRPEPRPGAYLRTPYGGTRFLERLAGEQLPRIC